MRSRLRPSKGGPGVSCLLPACCLYCWEKFGRHIFMSLYHKMLPFFVGCPWISSGLCLFPSVFKISLVSGHLIDAMLCKIDGQQLQIDGMGCLL